MRRDSTANSFHRHWIEYFPSNKCSLASMWASSHKVIFRASDGLICNQKEPTRDKQDIAHTCWYAKLIHNLRLRLSWVRVTTSRNRPPRVSHSLDILRDLKIVRKAEVQISENPIDSFRRDAASDEKLGLHAPPQQIEHERFRLVKLFRRNFENAMSVAVVCEDDTGWMRTQARVIVGIEMPDTHKV